MCRNGVRWMNPWGLVFRVEQQLLAMLNFDIPIFHVKEVHEAYLHV